MRGAGFGAELVRETHRELRLRCIGLPERADCGGRALNRTQIPHLRGSHGQQPLDGESSSDDEKRSW